MAPPDLRIFTSHPVQYQAPLFRELVESGLKIEVGYYHQGAAGRVARDAEFGIEFKWDIDLLSGYPYRIFLAQQANYKANEQIKLTPQIVSWVLRNRKTPILFVGWFVEIVWFIWLLCVMARIPTMVLCETTPISFSATPKPRWRESLLRWLLQHTKACLFIGKRNRAFLSKMGVPDERLFYTPYSIDNQRFETEFALLLPRRSELCYQHGLDSELPTFLFCGKLISKKRPLQLLEAYLEAGLQEKAQLLFVGNGVLLQELRLRAKEAGAKNVHFLGFFNQTQMPLAYVLGEVLCLISDETETWGLVVNEALACGRPVLVSDKVGCAPDLVKSQNGWVVPLDDHQALTKTLLSAYERRAEWSTVGREGQKLVGRHTFAAMLEGIRSALTMINDDFRAA
jgi:glycosyltransferase involved in cell wall biosynthesis